MTSASKQPQSWYLTALYRRLFPHVRPFGSIKEEAVGGLMPCHNHFGMHSSTHLNHARYNGRHSALFGSELGRQGVLFRRHLALGSFQPRDLQCAFVTLATGKKKSQV